MEAELTEMVGATVFQRLLAYLRQRDRLRAQRVALPHPAVRYPKPVAASGFSSVEDQFEQGQAAGAKAEGSRPAPAPAPAEATTAPTKAASVPSQDAILLPE
jgi:hypothetical protein